MMDVENRTVPPAESLPEPVKTVDSDDDEPVEIVPVTPTAKSPCAVKNGHSASPNTPLTASKKRKRLSSKEREERDRERAEKRAKMEEERQKKEEEKQRREEERLAKLAQKEEERRKREEERIQREEEKKRKHEEAEKLKKQKEEERRRKQEEEERRKKEKEEEKRKKEEERLKKHEEEERKKKEKEEERLKKLEEKDREKKKEEEKLAKQAKLFTSFFQKSPSGAKASTRRITPTLVGESAKSTDTTGGSSDEDKNANLFCPMMFEVKSNMALAPILRRTKLSTQEVATFDKNFFKGFHDDDMDVEEVGFTQPGKDYLVQLKTNRGRRCGRTELPADPDVQLIANTIIENPKEQGLVKWRYKLLQFHENQRPAYWGTWKRRSVTVKPRRPFSQEKEVDYDFDSDDEWEQEPEDAEDLADSDKEDDPDNADSEEDDEDGWLVPHGYISDDEGSKDEHMDKETLKLNEKDYFEGLKKQIKIRFPEIQTSKLGDFRIIFSPLMKKWKESCAKSVRDATMTDITELPQ